MRISGCDQTGKMWNARTYGDRTRNNSSASIRRRSSTSRSSRLRVPRATVSHGISKKIFLKNFSAGVSDTLTASARTLESGVGGTPQEGYGLFGAVLPAARQFPLGHFARSRRDARRKDDQLRRATIVCA